MVSWRKAGFRKIVSLAIVLPVTFFGAAFTNDGSESGTQAANARSRPAALAPDTINLIYQLSAQPELLNLAYLRYMVGSPENERSQLAIKAKSYYWYEGPRRQLAYQLHQDGPQPGSVTRSVFTINLPNSQLTAKEMERLFGQQHQTVFDQQSYPTSVYSFGPNTFVSFTQPHDTFRVQKIQVGYDGPPLPPPSQESLMSAYNYGKNKALETAMKTGNWQKALTWLRRDVALRPDDPYAHIQLGSAYRAGLMVNEAIAEYSTAARLGYNDPKVDHICRAALVDMKVLPPQPRNSDRRNYLAGGKNVHAAAGL